MKEKKQGALTFLIISGGGVLNSGIEIIFMNYNKS